MRWIDRMRARKTTQTAQELIDSKLEAMQARAREREGLRFCGCCDGTEVWVLVL